MNGLDDNNKQLMRNINCVCWKHFRIASNLFGAIHVEGLNGVVHSIIMINLSDSIMFEILKRSACRA